MRYLPAADLRRAAAKRKLSAMNRSRNLWMQEPGMLCGVTFMGGKQQMRGDEVLLQAKHLFKEFKLGSRFFYAVSDVNIKIYKGETLGLAGESGCGKSTLGRMLTGLIKPTKGEIFYDSDEITKLKSRQFKKIRREIQFIFQDPYASLDPRMRVADIVREPLLINKVGATEEQKARVDELLEIVGIPVDYKSRFPHQFSGGQRQRLGIARSLALNPQLIVCDEPVSALDVSIQAQVLNLLMKLQEQFSLTYLFISHDLNVVEHICDRACIMYLGRICEVGSKKDIFEHPRHPYTRFLLSANSILDPEHRKEDRPILTGDLASPVNPPSGCSFHPRCPYARELCSEREPDMTTEGNHQFLCHFPIN
jgi:oligopeptide/dipeptide ABC transporter ATP-binding protein